MQVNPQFQPSVAPSFNGNPGTPRKGMAIASLVLGILSLPTLGLLLVGGITSLVLGILAWRRAKQNPAHYGGKGLAVGGIVTSALSLALIPVLGGLAAIALPKLQENLRSGREMAAIQSLRTLHNSQAQYNALHGRFGTLQELVGAGLLNAQYVNGQALAGYQYTDSAVDAEHYCVHATRLSATVGSRDFNVSEDGTIRFLKAPTPAILPHGEGTPLADSVTDN